MSIRVILAVLLIQVFMGNPYFVTMAHASEFGRNLATCSSYTGCGACNSDSYCAFSNNKCRSNSSSSVWSETYNQSSEYAYCKSAVATGYNAVYNNKGGKLELGANSGTSSTSHSLCEWGIILDAEKSVKITINRSPINYEDITMFTFTAGTNKYYTGKDLSSCASNEVTMELEKIAFIRIRAKILNDQSNYSIVISQPVTPSSEAIHPVALVAIIVLGTGALMALTFGFMWLYFYIKRRQYVIQVQRFVQGRKENLEDDVKLVMDAMTQGKFKNLNLKFKELNCVICLEDFGPDDMISVTNE